METQRQAVPVPPLLDPPNLLRGHSMGALLAFETVGSLWETDVAQLAVLRSPEWSVRCGGRSTRLCTTWTNRERVA